MTVPGKDRGGHNGRAKVRTRERMILTAERLFAERGIDGVSLREIGVAAGQRNNSAAQYHFGSRYGLVRAILEFRMAQVDERRLALLAQFDAAGRSGDLRALVEAYVTPLAEMVGSDDGTSWYARFLAQLLARADPAVLNPEQYVSRGFTIVLTRLGEHLEALPPVLRSQRVMLAGILTVHALANHEFLLATGTTDVPTPLLAADLADTVVAVLTAPVSPATRNEVRGTSSSQAHQAPLSALQRVDQPWPPPVGRGGEVRGA
ncbi:MAG: TetR/AcrR family transcriptional regulator [Acidimicrobiales bacterium]